MNDLSKSPRNTTDAKPLLPLWGVRVADFTWIGAGSFTTKLLADLGADVIKIESSRHVDSLRNSPPFKDKIQGVNRSGYFSDRNTSKRSITVDLKSPRGLSLVKDIIRESDIVANNFSPGVMDKLGLGYDVVRELNPGAIFIAMSAQGAEGPDARSIGFGMTLAAISGLHYFVGEPDRYPTGTGTNYPDHIPNPTHAAFAVLAALRHQRRTGEGQMIDLAQTEPMVALLGSAMVDAAVNKRNPQRVGNRGQFAAPRGVYPCRGEDRWIAISVADDDRWAALLNVLGAGQGPHTAQWKHAEQRFAQQDAIDVFVADLTKAWDAHELMAVLQENGVAAGVVQDAADVVDRDPQLAHRDHWRKLKHPEMGETLYSGQPFKLASVEVGPLRPAPLLGEHTEEVLREVLGIEPEVVKALTDEGVLS
jgi:benzylsuccinate CoA-transferase BbsF subunit